MTRRLGVLALAAVAAGLLTAAPAAAQDKKIKVLIIDGQNNHQWQLTTPLMKKELEDCGRFTVDVATSPPAPPKAPAKPKEDTPEALAKYKDELAKVKLSEARYNEAMAKFHPDLSRYDVLLSNYNGLPWSKELNAQLEDLLKEGKIALVIVHAANNSFTGKWAEYDRMIGMGWRGNTYGDRLTLDAAGKEVRVPKGQGPGAGHGSRHPFLITVRDTNHPVTKGMPTEWLHTIDELYQGMRGPVENVQLLATAFADPAKGGKASSGQHEPMIWTVSYGKGRVFHTPMGHDVNGMRCVGFQTTLLRGTEWAATGKVTIPIPSNFPTADKVSVVPAAKK